MNRWLTAFLIAVSCHSEPPAGSAPFEVSVELVRDQVKIVEGLRPKLNERPLVKVMLTNVSTSTMPVDDLAFAHGDFLLANGDDRHGLYLEVTDPNGRTTSEFQSIDDHGGPPLCPGHQRAKTTKFNIKGIAHASFAVDLKPNDTVETPYWSQTFKCYKTRPDIAAHKGFVELWLRMQVMPGVYSVRAIFDTSGIDGVLRSPRWQGRVVSKPVTFKVVP